MSKESKTKEMCIRDSLNILQIVTHFKAEFVNKLLTINIWKKFSTKKLC